MNIKELQTLIETSNDLAEILSAWSSFFSKSKESREQLFLFRSEVTMPLVSILNGKDPRFSLEDIARETNGINKKSHLHRQKGMDKEEEKCKEWHLKGKLLPKATKEEIKKDIVTNFPSPDALYPWYFKYKNIKVAQCQLDVYNRYELWEVGFQSSLHINLITETEEDIMKQVGEIISARCTL